MSRARAAGALAGAALAAALSAPCVYATRSGFTSSSNVVRVVIPPRR